MIIGLTGQTGAGKTTVCYILKKNGLDIIDCDKLSRELTVKESSLTLALANAFGKEILFKDGSLNRRALADIAFSCSEKTALLNSITHPAIIAGIEKRLAGKDGNTVLDAPTLFESQADRLCDKTLAVLSTADKRRIRIMHRDGISQAQAQARMNAQQDDDFYAQRADACIRNDGGEEELEEQIKCVLKQFGVND